MLVEAQSWARNVVPLNPTQACLLTRSERKPAVNVRWTSRTFCPLRVDGVICLSAAVFTQAASTISPVQQPQCQPCFSCAYCEDAVS